MGNGRRRRELRALKRRSPDFDWPELPVVMNPEHPGKCVVCMEQISCQEPWAVLQGEADDLMYQAHLSCVETLAAVHGNISNLRAKAGL